MENFKKFCKEKSITLFFPIAVILTIVPLIVRMKKVTVDPAAVKLVGETTEMDLFSQNKAFMLMFFCGVLILLSIIFFKDLFKKKDKITLISIGCMGIFFIFSLISTLSSKYRQTAIWGYYDKAEGIVTIGCYLILFIYCIYAFKNTEDYKYITYPLMIVVSINAFLGLFQYFGSDLIKTNLGQLISIPSKYNFKASDLDLLYDSKRLYGTLYHYNYVGSFVAIVLPILFIAAAIEFEHVMYKVGLMCSCLLSIWLLLGSTSRAGLIGVIVSLIAGIIIFGKLLKPKWKPILISVAVICVLITGANFALGNKIFSRIPSLASDVISLFKSNDDFNLKDNVPIRDIQYTDNGGAVAVLQNDSLEIYVENGQYMFRDSLGNNVDYTKKDNNLTTTDSRFSNISFTYGKLPDANRSNGIYLNLNSKPAFIFKLSKNKLHLVDNNTLEEIDLIDAESIGFKGKEKIGSARGYIWSRTLPLLKGNLIKGYGPDTFMYEFPQNDMIAKLYAYGESIMTVDKPHNMYLQIAFSSGFIALIAFLATTILYIIDSFRLYALKDKYSVSESLGAATSLGVLGYLAAGVFNDSVISVAPIFWIVFGTGFALNHINRKNKLENK